MPVCQMLMRTAGGALEGMSLDAFIRQATAYEDEDDLYARHARFWEEIGRPHPFAVRRVRQLVKWVSEGEFDPIRSGHYVRRGQEPPPSAEFDAAVGQYSRRPVRRHGGPGGRGRAARRRSDQCVAPGPTGVRSSSSQEGEDEDWDDLGPE